MDWDKIRLGSWSAIGGAMALAFIGFNYGGWVTGGTAAAMAKQIAADTVAERLASICVAQFKPGLGEGPEAQGNEGQRFLGHRPLYRKAELGDHARRGEIR